MGEEGGHIPSVRFPVSHKEGQGTEAAVSGHSLLSWKNIAWTRPLEAP